MKTMEETWNDPKRLDILGGAWLLIWFLIWVPVSGLLWRSFGLPIFPQNLVGGSETGVAFVAGLLPAYVFFWGRRRILIDVKP